MAGLFKQVHGDMLSISTDMVSKAEESDAQARVIAQIAESGQTGGLQGPIGVAFAQKGNEYLDAHTQQSTMLADKASGIGDFAHAGLDAAEGASTVLAGIAAC